MTDTESLEQIMWDYDCENAYQAFLESLPESDRLQLLQLARLDKDDMLFGMFKCGMKVGINQTVLWLERKK